MDRLCSIEEQIKDLEEKVRARDLVLMDLREERLRLKQRNPTLSR